MRLVLVRVRDDLAILLRVVRPCDPLGEIPLQARAMTSSLGQPPLEHPPIPFYHRLNLTPLAENTCRMG